MDSFLKQAAGQVSAAADKAATTAQARFGDNVAEQVGRRPRACSHACTQRFQKCET